MSLPYVTYPTPYGSLRVSAVQPSLLRVDTPSGERLNFRGKAYRLSAFVTIAPTGEPVLSSEPNRRDGNFDFYRAGDLPGLSAPPTYVKLAVVAVSDVCRSYLADHPTALSEITVTRWIEDLNRAESVLAAAHDAYRDALYAVDAVQTASPSHLDPDEARRIITAVHNRLNAGDRVTVDHLERADVLLLHSPYYADTVGKSGTVTSREDSTGNVTVSLDHDTTRSYHYWRRELTAL